MRTSSKHGKAHFKRPAYYRRSALAQHFRTCNSMRSRTDGCLAAKQPCDKPWTEPLGGLGGDIIGFPATLNAMDSLVAWKIPRYTIHG